MWVTRRQWLYSLCTWLDVGTEPRQADLIVYLGGEESSRAKLAAQLYQEEYAPRIIASGHVSRINDGLAILEQQGVRTEDVIINNQASNTWDEAQQVMAILRDEHATSALVVTSPSHTRRAQATYEKLQNDSRIMLTFVSSTATFQCVDWWNTISGRYTMQYEYPRIFFYLLRYGVWSF